MIVSRMRDARRGQALIETVVFLPLFLLALFGIIWFLQLSVQFERVQTALRYSWALSQRTSPYTDYSFNAMYRQIDAATSTPPTVACTAPLTALLSDGAPYTSTQTVTASPSFWTPTGATQSCLATGYFSYVPGTGDDVILSMQEPTIAAPVAVPESLQGAIGSATTSVSLSEYFFKQIGVDAVLACYQSFQTMQNASLNYVYPDNTSSGATPTFPSYADNIASLHAATEGTSDYFALSPHC